MKKKLENILKDFFNSFLKELDSITEKEEKTSSKDVKTLLTSPSNMKCCAPKQEYCTAVKLSPPIPTNNFSVFLYDEKTDMNYRSNISYLEHFNILEVDYSPNTNIMSLIVEDTISSDSSLEEVLLNLKETEFNDLTLSIDIFDNQSELRRSLIFNNVKIERFLLLEPLKLFKYNYENNTLKYKVLFSFEEYSML